MTQNEDMFKRIVLPRDPKEYISVLKTAIHVSFHVSNFRGSIHSAVNQSM
ncbi:MAG: hypothetical protein LBH07_06075 [Treponema sp.]|nr:hypothetical protein [Treponema sp.]